MKRTLFLLPWLLCLVCAGFGGWSMHARAVSNARSDSLVTVLDSLQFKLGELELASYQLKRERDFNENYLQDLLASQDDAKRVYEMKKAASDEAIAQGAEAIRQSKLKDVALKDVEAARTEEQKQRLLAEAQKDSVEAEQRRTESLNQRLRASKVAQNSLALKGDPRLRGLMAVEALRSMENGGGDGNNEEIVRALHGALDELERAAPVGVQRLGSGPRAMRMEGSELRALGNDGLLLGIEPTSWRKRTVADLSKRTGTGGKAFLSGGYVLATDGERRISISSVDGSLIAMQERTSHQDDITAMAAFADGTGLVSGDRNGLLVVWTVEGDRLRMVNEHTIGGIVRVLVSEPGSGTIIAVNGTEKLSIVGKDGSHNTVALSDADRGNCAAAGLSGEVLIGTHQGAVFTLLPGDRDLRRIHNGGGRRVETLACMPSEGGSVAMVDALGQLTVFDRRKSGGTDFQMRLTGVPNALAFGSAEVIYLSYEDRTVRRVFANSRSLADRVCALAGRSWTSEEWAKHIGEGTPEPTCAQAP